MSVKTKKMDHAATAHAPTMGGDKSTPKKGEQYRCRQCGMEVQVTADCKCNDTDHVHFQCCGQELQKA